MRRENRIQSTSEILQMIAFRYYSYDSCHDGCQTKSVAIVVIVVCDHEGLLISCPLFGKTVHNSKPADSANFFTAREISLLQLTFPKAGKTFEDQEIRSM